MINSYGIRLFSLQIGFRVPMEPDDAYHTCIWVCTSLRNSPEGKILSGSSSSGKGGQVIIWKLYELTPRGQPPKSEIRTPNHSIVAVLPPPPSRTNAQVDLKDLTSMSWSKDGQYLAVGHQDASIQIWSWKGELIKSHDKTHTAPVFDLDWSADGSKLISAGLDGLSILWQTESIKEMRSLWANTGHESELAIPGWL